MTLYQSNFAAEDTGWREWRGTWKIRDGTLVQESGRQFAHALAGDDRWTDYTFTIKARKTGGREGFLVYFHVPNENNFLFWNLGGWGNTRSGLEQTIDGTKEQVGESVGVKIDTGRWYDIKIKVTDRAIRCSLDGKLITGATEPTAPPRVPIYASAAQQRDPRSDPQGVNLDDGPQAVKIDLVGTASVPSQGTLEVLTGDPDAMSSLATPKKIVPKKSLANAGKTFEPAFPAHSVSILRLEG